jgi:hypothetical protein
MPLFAAAVCGACAHLHHLGEPLWSHFVLFAALALISIALGTHWDATFAATGIPLRGACV